jgi:hypothetical protein
VLRWRWGSVWQEWLRGWSGSVIHFPDYDPAGLRIFASEVLSRCPDAKLMVPKGFEALLKKRGNRELYLRQEALSSDLANDPRMSLVAASLKWHRKALEQEALLYLACEGDA